MGYKTIVVTINGDVNSDVVEHKLPQVDALLDEGYKIVKVYQIATNVAASNSASKNGAIVLTYVLAK